MKKKNTTTTVTNDRRNRRRKLVCCVRNKRFRSLYALSGHMRIHLDRDWRGTQLPEALPHNGMSNNSSSGYTLETTWSEGRTDTTVSSIDLLAYLPRSWSSTGKRGRKSAADVTAADGLLTLSHRERRNSGKEILDPTPEPFARKLKIKIVSGKGSLWRIGTTYDNQKEENVKDRKGKKVIGTDCGVREKKRKKMCLAKKKKIITVSSSSTETDENVFLLSSAGKNRYKCNNCGKSFPTFQALGGHRSTHSRKKSTPSRAEKDTSNASESTRSSPIQVDSSLETPSLGFTKWGGQSGRAFLDFDLNQLPFGMP